MSGPPDLGWGGVAIAATLIALHGVLSVVFSRGFGRKIIMAAGRTLAQLTVMGFLLVPVFEHKNPILITALAALMVLVAARAAVNRASHRTRNGVRDAFFSLLVSSGCTVAVGVVGVMTHAPWWEPRYLLPILGMVLGNSLTGVSLGLEALLSRFRNGWRSVEVLLAAGATAREAARPAVQDALRIALIPMLNAMTVVGLVSIPGMMTGQLLAGADPLVASRYQILIMFLIAFATALGSVLAITLAARAVFDEDGRLRPERIYG